MTPIEQAIQAADNAATAHGFVQALEQAAEKMRSRAAQIVAPDEVDPPDDGSKLVASELLATASAIDSEVAKRKTQVEHLNAVAHQAAALAYASQPDLAKVRAAMAVILGAG